MIKIQVSDLTIPRIPSTGIIRLVLTNFRTYQKLSLSCDTRPIVLTGPNGIGKTNILEAISFLSPGRGLRNAKLAQVTHRTAAINNVDNFCDSLSQNLSGDKGEKIGTEKGKD